MAIRVDQIKTPSAESFDNTSAFASESMRGAQIIGIMQGFCSLLIIIGLIVGIIYMIKSKKTKGKRILIGGIIIIIPIILNLILNIVRFNFNMSLNL